MSGFVETIRGLRSEDISLQLLFLYSTGQIDSSDFFNHRSLISTAANVEPDFFLSAVQGYLLQLKSSEIRKQDQRGVQQALDTAFGLADKSAVLESISDILGIDTESEYLDCDQEVLEQVKQNAAEAKQLRAATLIVTATMGHLRRMRRPTYRQITPFAPIMRSSELFDTSTDWMLNTSPEHLVNKMTQLDEKHRQSKQSIAAMEKISKREIGELLMFGQFLAAIRALTDSYLTDDYNQPSSL